MDRLTSRVRNIWRSAARFSRGLSREQRGAIIVFVAVSIIPLIGFIGIGTDTARSYLTKSRLSSALDAAALAGGRNFFSPSRDDDIRMFFNANFPPGYMGATVSGPNIIADEQEQTVSLDASATVPTSFMRLFGYNDVTVFAEAEVTRKMTALDVVLAFDLSGSMGGSAGGGGTRIAAARTAGTELVNILYGNQASNAKLNIGLVPWNGKVNVQRDGTVFDPAATVTQAVPAFVNPITGANQAVVYLANNSPVPLLSAPPADWKGAVFNRFLDDGDPGTDADILYGPVTTAAGTDWQAWEPVGPEGEPVSGWARCALAVSFSECTPTLRHGITPLQNTKQVILDAISALQSPQGVTNIPNGLGWAWRVLKPDAPFTEAIANPPYERQQAIVLLTDGENYGGSGDGYKGTFGLGSAAQPEMDDRLRKVSDNIKADGVVIYVVQFANSGTSLQTLLQGVASGPSSPFYHYAPTADDLQRVFREVATHLSELRLSK